jgi:signal transduction histidine kinase
VTTPSPHRTTIRTRLPRRTVRLRLTLFYGLLLLGSGAVLLAITYVLVDSRISGNLITPPQRGTISSSGIVTAPPAVADALRAQQATYLHQLLMQSGIALAIMAVTAMALSWLAAGRTLGPLHAITMTTRQISERNLHERLAFSGPRDELTDLADTIDRLLARLDAAFDSQRRFIANASHELRTPLMLSQTLLQVALADPGITPDSLRATCREVISACKDQERLIQALLVLARSQRGLDHHEPLDLAWITMKALDAREQETADSGLRVDATLSPAPAEGDPALAEILISNLLENAIRHNISGGCIEVTTGTNGGKAGFSIANSGPQVPADQTRMLLEPFQRLNEHRGHSQGLGLGLSIAAAIAHAHNASLSITPRPSGGLLVEVEFCPGHAF